MARIRTIKPEFFRHEALYEAECAERLPLRIAFAGLFTVADREGRFKWAPRVLKLDVLPFDDLKFEDVLCALEKHRFIVRYEVGGEVFGYIPTFTKHQHVNQREAESNIPSPDEAGARTCENIPARVEGKGREQEREQEGKGTEPAPEAESPKVGFVTLPSASIRSSHGFSEHEIRDLKLNLDLLDIDQELSGLAEWADWKDITNINERKRAISKALFNKQAQLQAAATIAKQGTGPPILVSSAIVTKMQAQTGRRS